MSGRKDKCNGQQGCEHLFPTALAGRSLNHTDCTVTVNKIRGLDEKEMLQFVRIINSCTKLRKVV